MNNFLFSQARTTSRILILLVTCVYWMQSQGQQAKSSLQLADQYFAAGEYYTAANLYEQFLNPPKKQRPESEFPLNIKGRRGAVAKRGSSRSDILFKQAESYRLANYWAEAAKCYKEYEEESSSNNVDALYWYAVCQRSLGNYDAAEESLKQILSSTGANSRKEDAKKELETLHYIRQQLSRPDSVLINVQKLNIPSSSEKGAYAVVHISDNQFLLSSTRTDSIQVSGINPYHSRLFYATLNNGNIDQMTPVALPSAGPLDNQGAATISADGNYLYYSQWKIENGHTVSSIYYAVKQANGWSLPVLLPRVNINGHNTKQPFCSTDGKYLFFASDRPGGSGKFDIWYAPLKNDGTTGEPVNAGPVVNTTGDEQAPFYHNNTGTLVFSSNGRSGMGGYDLFSAKGSEVTWNLPENIGYPVNSSRDDIYFFAKESSALLTNAIVSSDRGSGCCLETYRISKASKNKRLTGIVRHCKDSTPVVNAVITLRDAQGKTAEAITDDEGKYVFDKVNAYQDPTLTINRELHKESVSAVAIENIDESDLLVDRLINSDICIEEKLVIKAENVVTVYFDFDRSILKEAAINKLDSIYNVLVEFPAATIQVSGYTDGLGTEQYNKKLSDKRAKACADYLIVKGIDSARITFESFGACCPIEMEIINGRDNPDGRSLNRRALINVKKD